jgi:hypothetical protein
MCFSHPLIVHWGEIIYERILFIVFTNCLETFSRDVYDNATAKAELLQEGIFFFIHLFARDVLVMKKLEIEKLSPLLLYQF